LPHAIVNRVYPSYFPIQRSQLTSTNRDTAQSKDIARIAEEAVLGNLRLQRWTKIILRTDGDVQALNPGGALQLFRIKTAVFPNEPSSLMGAEEEAFLKKAQQLEAMAYEAKVHLNEHHVADRIQYDSL